MDRSKYGLKDRTIIRWTKLCKERKIDEQIDRCIVGQLHEQIDEQKVLKNRQLYKQIDGQLNRFEYIFNIKYLQVTT